MTSQPQSTPAASGSGVNILGLIGPLLSALVQSPLLSERRIKINIGGRDVDARPVLKGVAADLADGKLDPGEIQELIGLVTLAILTAPAHVATAPTAGGTPTAPTGVGGVPVSVPPAPVPVPVPVPVEPPHVVVTSLTITHIVAESLHFEGRRDVPEAPRPGIAGVLYPPDHVQQAGERGKFNFTPYAGSIRIPDEINRRWMADGHSPIVQPRWGEVGPSGEEIIHTSGINRPDKWSLQGYDRASSPNAGWTHVLELNEPLGSGQTKCFDYVFVPEEYNNGQRVESPRFYFMAD